MQLDHVNVRTSDLAAMKAFFESAVGLTEGDRPPFPFPGHWMYADGKPVIHMVEGKPDGTGCVDHVAFRCTGLADARERLTSSGHAFDERVVPGTGITQLFVTGPEGVQVELQFPPND